MGKTDLLYVTLDKRYARKFLGDEASIAPPILSTNTAKKQSMTGVWRGQTPVIDCFFAVKTNFLGPTKFRKVSCMKIVLFHRKNTRNVIAPRMRQKIARGGIKTDVTN